MKEKNEAKSGRKQLTLWRSVIVVSQGSEVPLLHLWLKRSLSKSMETKDLL